LAKSIGRIFADKQQSKAVTKRLVLQTKAFHTRLIPLNRLPKKIIFAPKIIKMPKQPAIFLDRDGTIIEDAGYINKVSMVEFYPFSFKALQNLQNHFMLFIITNQSGISKGITSEDEVKAVNRHIENELRSNHITIYETFYCPHKNEDLCSCKKPSPYFINQAARLYDVDLSKSFMIGDHPSDVECGINAGVTPVYVLSGHGQKHQNELEKEVYTCANIWEASEFILSTIKM
jgi:histidinol-phosphate phosphatase family protein